VFSVLTRATAAQAAGPMFLGRAASGWGSLVNSVLVQLGDTFGLYHTGQYSFDEEPDGRGDPLMVRPLTWSRRPGTGGLSCDAD
jgi:hypothetical protein